MPNKVQTNVQELLAKPDFYPDNPDRESIAWGTCYKNEVEASVEFTNVSGEIVYLGSDDEKDILMFNNAILCHQGMNSNRDVVPEGEIANLVATLPGRPIDLEHDYNKIHGVFTSAEQVESNGVPAASVNGIIWADRFESSAKGIKSGAYKLSIEADAEYAECSICAGKFKKSINYCEHLISKTAYNASRTLRGLKAKGGALTQNPADTRAGFADSNIRMVAFHQEANLEEEDRMSEKRIAELEASEAELTKDKGLLETQLSEMTEKLDAKSKEAEDLSAKNETLVASVESLEAEVKSEKSRAQELLSSVRRSALSASMSDEEWEAQRETVMSMPDKAFALLASVAKKGVKREEANINLEGEADTTDTSWEV